MGFFQRALSACQPALGVLDVALSRGVLLLRRLQRRVRRIEDALRLGERFGIDAFGCRVEIGLRLVVGRLRLVKLLFGCGGFCLCGLERLRGCVVFRAAASKFGLGLACVSFAASSFARASSRALVAAARFFSASPSASGRRFLGGLPGGFEFRLRLFPRRSSLIRRRSSSPPGRLRRRLSRKIAALSCACASAAAGGGFLLGCRARRAPPDRCVSPGRSGHQGSSARLRRAVRGIVCRLVFVDGGLPRRAAPELRPRSPAARRAKARRRSVAARAMTCVGSFTFAAAFARASCANALLRRRQRGGGR